MNQHFVQFSNFTLRNSQDLTQPSVFIKCWWKKVSRQLNLFQSSTRRGYKQTIVMLTLLNHHLSYIYVVCHSSFSPYGKFLSSPKPWFYFKKTSMDLLKSATEFCELTDSHFKEKPQCFRFRLWVLFYNQIVMLNIICKPGELPLKDKSAYSTEKSIFN